MDLPSDLKASTLPPGTRGFGAETQRIVDRAYKDWVKRRGLEWDPDFATGPRPRRFGTFASRRRSAA